MEMKNAFYGFISRLDMTKEKISELEFISTESLKTEKHREQKLKKYPRMLGQLQNM